MAFLDNNNTHIDSTSMYLFCEAGQHMVVDVYAYCAFGQYSEAGWNVCTVCKTGKYSASAASPVCVDCASDKHSTVFGSHVLAKDCLFCCRVSVG